MTQQRQPPRPELLQEFGERLSQFRASLPEEQQPLLDTMLTAALRPDKTSDEVQPFWTQYRGISTSANPSWYDSSGAAAWNNTSWGTAWLNY